MSKATFFVDSTGIDCDTCRQLAPTTFTEDGDYSTVFRQPETAREEIATYQALITCPMGSIGTKTKYREVFSEAQASFPLHIKGGVF